MIWPWPFKRRKPTPPTQREQDDRRTVDAARRSADRADELIARLERRSPRPGPLEKDIFPEHGQ